MEAEFGSSGEDVLAGALPACTAGGCFDGRDSLTETQVGKEVEVDARGGGRKLDAVAFVLSDNRAFVGEEGAGTVVQAPAVPSGPASGDDEQRGEYRSSSCLAPTAAGPVHYPN